MISTTGELDSTGPLFMNEVNPMVEQTPLILKQSYVHMSAAILKIIGHLWTFHLEADGKSMKWSDRLAGLVDIRIQYLCLLECFFKEHFSQAACLSIVSKLYGSKDLIKSVGYHTSCCATAARMQKASVTS